MVYDELRHDSQLKNNRFKTEKSEKKLTYSVIEWIAGLRVPDERRLAGIADANGDDAASIEALLGHLPENDIDAGLGRRLDLLGILLDPALLRRQLLDVDLMRLHLRHVFRIEDLWSETVLLLGIDDIGKIWAGKLLRFLRRCGNWMW